MPHLQDAKNLLEDHKGYARLSEERPHPTGIVETQIIITARHKDGLHNVRLGLTNFLLTEEELLELIRSL